MNFKKNNRVIIVCGIMFGMLLSNSVYAYRLNHRTKTIIAAACLTGIAGGLIGSLIAYINKSNNSKKHNIVLAGLGSACLSAGIGAATYFLLYNHIKPMRYTCDHHNFAVQKLPCAHYACQKCTELIPAGKFTCPTCYTGNFDCLSENSSGPHNIRMKRLLCNHWACKSCIDLSCKSTGDIFTCPVCQQKNAMLNDALFK